MKLYDERFNQICAKMFMLRLVKEGINLKPSEVKREIQNISKELNFPAKDVAEAYKIALNYLSGFASGKLDEIINE
jgi:hypothetical protein